VSGAVNIHCADDVASRGEMNRLLLSGECHAAVTMHHNFPIGTATVGRVITPSRGKEMFIATTTGTPSTDRTESLVLGALYGIIAAKSCGMRHPAVGLLNIDGARRAETALRKLQSRGYPLQFAKSVRAGGGAIMRGNDVLLGAADVLVCDPLTGNVLMKMLSAFNSGGDRECSGYGYGPGVGKGVRAPVLIVSRTSDAPVVFNAIHYAEQVIKGAISKITDETLAEAGNCGLYDILEGSRDVVPAAEGNALPPESEPVTESVSGVEVTDIDAAVRLLWENSVYAESGMGCTGPVVMVSGKRLERALELLRGAGYL